MFVIISVDQLRFRLDSFDVFEGVKFLKVLLR